MKIPKTFRLSEQAVAVLDAQANATQFLEDLILNSEPLSLASIRSLLLEVIGNPGPKPRDVQADMANLYLEKPVNTRRPVTVASSTSFKKLDNGNCKIHGVPLTLYGRCLVKGCKNG